MVCARKSVFKSSYTSALQNPINTRQSSFVISMVLGVFTILNAQKNWKLCCVCLFLTVHCKKSMRMSWQKMTSTFSVKFTDPQPYSTMQCVIWNVSEATVINSFILTQHWPLLYSRFLLCVWALKQSLSQYKNVNKSILTTSSEMFLGPTK